MPIERPSPLTFPAIRAHSPRLAPPSAAAPTIFSSSTVVPTPRRPAVYRLSLTATSSLTTTAVTSLPSAWANSAAISKFIMSPV